MHCPRPGYTVEALRFLLAERTFSLSQLSVPQCVAAIWNDRIKPRYIDQTRRQQPDATWSLYVGFEPKIPAELPKDGHCSGSWEQKRTAVVYSKTAKGRNLRTTQSPKLHRSNSYHHMQSEAPNWCSRDALLGSPVLWDDSIV